MRKIKRVDSWIDVPYFVQEVFLTLRDKDIPNMKITVVPRDGENMVMWTNVAKDSWQLPMNGETPDCGNPKVERLSKQQLMEKFKPISYSYNG